MEEKNQKKEVCAQNLTEPEVLHYSNYRVYLQDYCAYRKANGHFSYRGFAEKAGLSSHAHLKLAMDGKRDITKNTVMKLIKGLGLEGARAVYFENLVFFCQAKTDDERHLYYQRAREVSPVSKLHKIKESQFRIFSEWYHSVIMEMAGLADFKADAEWVARRLGGRITASQAAESFKLLVELGLWVKTAGGFRQADALLTTDDEVKDMMVKLYHYQMLTLAKDCLTENSASERDVSALTFGIKREDFPKLKKHLQLMRKELLDFSAKSGESDDIVQVNIQLFPLTRGL